MAEKPDGLAGQFSAFPGADVIVQKRAQDKLEGSIQTVKRKYRRKYVDCGEP
jgi:hypothetical protein